MKNIYSIFVLFAYFSSNVHAQCTTEIGTLPTDTAFVCENGMEIFTHENYMLNENDALIYVLHTENGLEEILDTFPSNEIHWQELGTISWNTLYYISAIGGLDVDMDGVPDDLVAECTVVSNVMPLVFAAPTYFLDVYNCSDNFVDTLCQYMVDVQWLLTGGMEYTEGNLERQFLITDSFTNDTVPYDPEMSFGFTVFDINNPLVVDFQIIDSYDCANNTFSFDIYTECIEPIGSYDFFIISDMPSELQVICDGEESHVRAGCIHNLTFPTPTYFLSIDSMYNPNSVLATNIGVGRFTNQDAYPYLNQTLYVFGEVLDPFENTNYTEDPTPIVFLKPLELTINVLDCNSTTGFATLMITPNGGLPEFDNAAIYTIGGDISNSMTFGNFTVVQVPLSESMNWKLNVTVSDEMDCQAFFELEEPCVVNIEEQASSNSFLQNIFPNPAQDLLFLQFQTGPYQDFSLQLWDVNGKIVLQKSITTSAELRETTLEVNHLPVGMYYLKVMGKEAIEIRKVVIER